MTAPSIEDNLDSIEIVVEQDELRGLTKGRFRFLVGRLVVQETEVRLAPSKHSMAALIVLRAALRSVPATTRPMTVVVPNEAAIRFVRGLRVAERLPPAVNERLLNIRELLAQKAPAARLVPPPPKRKPSRQQPNRRHVVIVAPTIVTQGGERRGGYVLAGGGVMQSPLYGLDPAWSSIEALLAILMTATRGLDEVGRIYVYTEDSGIHAIFDGERPPPTTSLMAARMVRSLESRFLISTVEANYLSALWADGSPPDAWAAAS